MATHELPTPDEVLSNYSHPEDQRCLQDPAVRELVIYLDLVQEGLWKTLHPDGEYKDDEYFQYEEGMVMRRTQLMRLAVEFLRDQGKLKE